MRRAELKGGIRAYVGSTQQLRCKVCVCVYVCSLNPEVCRESSIQNSTHRLPVMSPVFFVNCVVLGNLFGP